MPAAPVTDVPGPAATSGPAAGTSGGARADVADASSTAPGRPAWTDGRAAGLDDPPAPAPHGPVVAAPTEPRRDDRSPTAAVGLVTPAAGVSAAAPPAAVAGSTPPGPGAPAHLAGQLVPAVSAIHRLGADGTHRVTVDVTPEELGPVRLTVEMRSGEMSLLLAGSSETSREALRAALPELRRMLDAAGMTTGQLDVRPDDLGSRPAWSDLSGGLPQGETGRGGSTGSDRASRTGGPAAGEGDVPSHVTRPDHDNSLDVRI
jgi:flagellar hook-length control protein FliK